MAQTYDTIVLGAGAMGSAAAYHSAKRGQRVLLLEQFELDHKKGSSHGHSRIIRYSYDHAPYIALARAVYPMWAALEEEAGEKLHINTGGIDFGPTGEAALENTFDTVSKAQIPHESLTPGEAQKRFPQFQFGENWKVLYQPDSGLLAASRCVLAHVRLAQQRGATIITESPVTEITASTNTVTVTTAKDTYSAGRLIITAGAWARSLLSRVDLDLPLRPLHAQEAYFRAEDLHHYEPGHFPVFIAHVRSLFDDHTFYGLPSTNGSGVKVGLHGGPVCNHPSEIDYNPDHETIDKVRGFTQKHLPGANAPLASARICLYTMTPDEHFVIDTHPAYPRVVIGAGFSGHGFKFSTLIGSILTDLALEGRTSHDISLFKASRFSG